MTEMLRGERWRALESVAPTGFESPLKAIRQATEGITTTGGKQILDEKGQPIKLTTGEAIAQAASFRPARIAEISQERRIESNIEKYYKGQRDEIYILTRRAKTLKDWDNISRLIQKFNISVMKYRGVIAPISARPSRSIMKPESDYLRWSMGQGEGGTE